MGRTIPCRVTTPTVPYRKRDEGDRPQEYLVATLKE